MSATTVKLAGNARKTGAKRPGCKLRNFNSLRSLRRRRAAGTNFVQASLNGTRRLPSQRRKENTMALPTRVMRTGGEPFESLRDLDTLMRGFFNREGSQTPFAPYGVDIREDSDHIYVEAELPGFKKDEIDITLENSTLTIAAERRLEQKREHGGGGGGGGGGNGGH